MDNARLARLYELLINGTATEEDRDEFARLMSDPRHSEQARTLIMKALNNSPADHRVNPNVTESILRAIVNASATEAAPAPKSRLIRLPWLRYAAAVLIVFAISIFILTQTNKKPALKQDVIAQQENFPAGGKKATLTLADGRTIVLDSSTNGELAKQGNTEIRKLAGGEIFYNKKPDAATDAQVMMNTMSTPKGGQYQLRLDDGTKVWLNAASSITYPAAFTGKERKVSVTGEVYFEVAKDRIKPFKVVVDNSSEIEVLGTSFNVNSYKDENSITTTLVEGAIRTTNKEKASVVLRPGQQAVIAHGKNIKVINDVNVDKVMDWKNGFFNFDNASLGEVMRKISRWYDIEVVYEKGIPEIVFGGEVSMNVSLTGLLNGLQKANVHFRIDNGRRLVVMP